MEPCNGLQHWAGHSYGHAFRLRRLQGPLQLTGGVTWNSTLPLITTLAGSRSAVRASNGRAKDSRRRVRSAGPRPESPLRLYADIQDVSFAPLLGNLGYGNTLEGSAAGNVWIGGTVSRPDAVATLTLATGRLSESSFRVPALRFTCNKARL